MQVYKFTKFTQQVSQSQALVQYRNAINAAIQTLEGLVNFNGQTIIVSTQAKQRILNACGSTMSTATHIYETPIGGQWRIFWAPTLNGGIIALMIGHLTAGNVLQQP